MSSDVHETSRKGPLFWVLTGGVLFLVLLFGGLFGIAYFAGTSNQFATPFDTMRTMVLKLGPNIEIIAEYPETNSLRVRDKSSGREFIYSVDSTTKLFHVTPGDASSDPKAPGK